MTKPTLVLVVSSILIALLTCGECPAGLAFSPQDPGTLPKWTADETAPGSNVWIVHLCPDPPSGPNPCTQTITFTINATGTGTVIDELHINRRAASVSVFADVGLSNRIDAINLIETSASVSDGLVGVVANINDTLGQVENINDLRVDLGRPVGGTFVGGDVIGPITCIKKTSGIGSGSSIRITSQGGNLRGNVTNKTAAGDIGSIHLLDFNNGVIQRDDGGLVEIRADRQIEGVYGKEIHARILGTEADGEDSFVEGLGQVETGRLGGSGLFKGEIRAEAMGKQGGENETDPVLIFRRNTSAGGMRGNIWLQRLSLLPGTQTDVPEEVRMEWDTLESLRGHLGTFSLGTIFPLNPGQPPSTVWSGKFAVVPDPALPPHDPPLTNEIVLDSGDGNGYTPPRSAASLGGGAVGVVPFRIHPEDSFPVYVDANGNVITNVTDISRRPRVGNPIRLRMRGPVSWDTGGSLLPFKIERHRADSESDTDWVDVTCAFTQTPDTTAANNGTVVLVEPVGTQSLPNRKPQRGYEYRILPAVSGSTTVLRSDVPHKVLPDDPRVSTETPLLFTVCNGPAVGDADDTGVVNFADVTSVLANYGSTACLKYGDADRNDTVDFADVTAILANFGATWCPDLGALGPPRGDGFAAMDLHDDGPTTAASTVMFITDALNLMGYASIDAFGDAIAQMDEASRNAEINRLGQLLEGVQ